MIVEYREIFASFDEEGQGRLPLNQVGPAVRATGRNPTEAEIASMIAPFQGKRGLDGEGRGGMRRSTA